VPAASDEFVVAWPTLWIVPAWIEQHCPIPDGFHKGRRFELADWQLWCTLNHYRVRPDAQWVPERPILAPSFHNRRSQVIGPQKSGKGPWAATIVAAEGSARCCSRAGRRRTTGTRAPSTAARAAGSTRTSSGEPRGMAWPTPLIQLTATSEDQVDNVYRPLKAMIRNGPLAERMLIRQEFVRCRTTARSPS
jgi:hypothetical protein